MESLAKTPARRGGGTEEDGEEHHPNPFISNTISHLSSTPNIQFRKEASRARWDDEMGMGEVLEKKGSMWATTGIIHGSRLYCQIEKIAFLSERGAALLSGSDGTTLSIKDIYKKIAEGTDGFCWESFEVYRHLKSLGYVVGRHDILWTMKNSMSAGNFDSLKSTLVNGSNVADDEMVSITQQFQEMQFNELKPTFQVYLPNSKFRKSSPGDPSFLLCLLRVNPPSRLEVENLEKKCNGIPLKYCFVDHGRSLSNSSKLVWKVRKGEHDDCSACATVAGCRLCCGLRGACIHGRTTFKYCIVRREKPVDASLFCCLNCVITHI